LLFRGVLDYVVDEADPLGGMRQVIDQVAELLDLELVPVHLISVTSVWGAV